MYQWGGLKMFFKPLPKISSWLPNILFITLHPVAFESVYDPTFLRIGSLSIGVIRRFLMVGPPFRCISMSYFLQVLLKLSLSPWWYGTVICGFWSLLLWGLEFLVLLFFFLGTGAWLLIFTLLRAHVGYLHFFKLLYKCSSFYSWVGPEQMVLALWNRIPIMLYLDGMAWWLSQCRYWCICVGFL